MRFAAFMGTLDEVELLAANIAHLRRIGVELIVVMDYGSTDGSIEVLEAAERDGDVWLFHVSLADDYDMWMDVEVKLARSSGVEWALFLDSDEFWLPATGSLHDMVDLNDADILIVDRHNVAMSTSAADVRGVPDVSPRGHGELLLHARGPDEYEKGLVRLADYLDRNPDEGWIRGGGREPKVMVRPEALARLHDGHHDVDSPPDRQWRRSSPKDVLIGHLPFSTLDRFDRKVANIRKSVALHPEWFEHDRGWQWIRWLQKADGGSAREEFEKQFLPLDVMGELREAGAVQSVAEMFNQRGASTIPPVTRGSGKRDGAPRDQAAKLDSGPFRVFDVAVGTEIGQTGDDTLAAVLIEAGPMSVPGRELVRAWWEAAQGVMSTGQPDRHQLDLAPRNFRVTDDGAWHFVEQGMTTRFALPAEVLAIRALMDLLMERIVRSGMPGVESSFSVRDAAAGLLGIVGYAIDDALLKLWIELEADLEIRTSAAPRSREAIRQALLERIEAPLATFLTGEALVKDLRRAMAEVSATADQERQRFQEAELELRETAQRAATQHSEAVARLKRAQQERTDLDERLRRLDERLRQLDQARLELARRLQRAEHERAELTRRTQRAEQALGWNEKPSRARRVAALLSHPRQLWLAVITSRPLRWLPNPLFDARWYLEQNDDVRQQGQNPYRHFRRHGFREARDPNRFFDTDWYLDRYPDVRSVGLNPLDHYLQFGGFEGRDPGPLFDSDWYLEQNPDVRATGLNPLLHYLRYGRDEGRRARGD